MARAAAFTALLETARVDDAAIAWIGESADAKGTTIAQVLKRPEITVEMLAPLLRERLVGAGLGVWRGRWEERLTPQ